MSAGIQVVCEIEPRHASGQLVANGKTYDLSVCAEVMPRTVGIESSYRFSVLGMKTSDVDTLPRVDVDNKEVRAPLANGPQLFLNQTGTFRYFFREDPPGREQYFTVQVDELFQLGLHLRAGKAPTVEAIFTDVHWISQRCDYCRVSVAADLRLVVVTAQALAGNLQGFAIKTYALAQVFGWPFFTPPQQYGNVALETNDIKAYVADYIATPLDAGYYPPHQWGYITNPVDHCPCLPPEQQEKQKGRNDKIGLSVGFVPPPPVATLVPPPVPFDLSLPGGTPFPDQEETKPSLTRPEPPLPGIKPTPQTNGPHSETKPK